MSAELFPYYEEELRAIRKLALEFAQQYPAAAGRLMLEQSRSADPHVERLLEGFAFLAGRVRHKIDDEFPELTDALLGVLYPHYLAPVPSVLVAEFPGDAVRVPPDGGFTIPRHSEVVTHPVQDVRCRYRTAYPVTLWPLRVAAARLFGPPWAGLRLPAGTRPPDGAVAAVQIQLECLAGATFADLTAGSLRFHLTGEDQTVAELYELILNGVSQVLLTSPDSPATPPVHLTPGEALRPVGFEPGESLLPYPPHSFPGYGLLTEFFACPAKFWFFDLAGLGRVCRPGSGFGRRLDVLLFLRRTRPNLEKAVDDGTFRLNCAPAVNLFPQTAEPVAVTQARYDYPVVPVNGSPAGYEVYSIDEVQGVDPEAGAAIPFRPFYGVDHGDARRAAGGEGTRDAYWHARRRPAARDGDAGTEVSVSLVDKGWDPVMPATTTLVVRTTCTNRELPAQLQRDGDRLRLELQLAAPLDGSPRCVRTPTLPRRPPRDRRGNYWRLLSHLSLNHLSLGGEGGRDALREILRLYDFSGGEAGQRAADVHALIVAGLTGLSTRRVVGRVALAGQPGQAGGGGYCRGVEVEVTLDEEKYIGTGAYLFAAVLERFVGLYATLNSFTQLVAVSHQGGRLIRRWPPRAGDKPLI